MKPSFNKKYALVFVVLHLVETSIALFVMDQIVRPFVGDVLVVVLIYSFVRMLFDVRHPYWLATAILLFSYMVELGQYFNLVSRLGLANSKFAVIVIGASFDWKDLLCYTIGFILILAESKFLPLRSDTAPQAES